MTVPNAPDASPTRSAASTVADVVAQTLRAYGVRFAFGIPGNDVLETVRACAEHGIKFVLAKSEPSAAFMADAIWQLSGAPAVLIPALGPGISNAMSGIAGALMERSAMIVLCGEMGTPNMAIYNHQVFDHVALCRPVTKYAEALNPRRAGQQAAKALDIALAWPAGPVMLNVPADSNRMQATDNGQSPATYVATGIAADALGELRAQLAGARNPLALIGRGSIHRDAAAAVAQFVAAWQLPFFATYKAKGVVDEHDPLCCGAVGLSPVVDGLNMQAVAEADLLVLIGFDPIELRDAWVDAWPKDKACITLDWAPTHDRIFPRGVEAYGSLDLLLHQLAPAVPRPPRALSASHSMLRDSVAEVVRPRGAARAISPAGLFHAIDDRITNEWTMTVDVGAHRILANHVLRCRTPGQLLQSNGLGCMGYAVPAAIAAQLAAPQRPVVAMLGDGCMLMTLGELAVAAELQSMSSSGKQEPSDVSAAVPDSPMHGPLIIVVLNDAKLSLIALKQDKMQMAARGVDFESPDFARIAEGFGAKGVRVDTLAQFETAFDQALSARMLTVIDAMIDPAEYWEQM